MILGILQARVSSTRLPGKVLRPLLGRPMLARQIERMRRSIRMEHLLVATSDHGSDDPIQALCEAEGVDCCRGNLEDVLDRFYQAAHRLAPLHVVRLTGDCPLIDPEIIDRVVEHHIQGAFEYTSNSVERTFPDGLDVEVMTFEALARMWRDAGKPSEREHVTPYLYNHPEQFRIGKVTQAHDQSRMRWTVDEPADFEMITRIYEALYPLNASFGMTDVLDFLALNPNIQASNAMFGINEGYERSLHKDIVTGIEPGLKG
jgi:spore coat polysaccharide biosynthesis protein SpsF